MENSLIGSTVKVNMISTVGPPNPVRDSFFSFCTQRMLFASVKKASHSSLAQFNYLLCLCVLCVKNVKLFNFIGANFDKP